MYAESFTRKYFVYYTKRVNDNTTMRILNQFREEVLATLTFDDNRKSDNKKLDTNEDKFWMSKGRATIVRITIQSKYE